MNALLQAALQEFHPTAANEVRQAQGGRHRRLPFQGGLRNQLCVGVAITPLLCRWPQPCRSDPTWYLCSMKSTVVIADDHPIVLAGICNFIDRNPEFEIIGLAQTPLALIRLMQSREPDIVICDYSMPCEDGVGDGLKLISYLNRNFQKARILIFTMLSSSAIVEEMYRAGASGVVRKSGDLRELRSALIMLAAQQEYRSSNLPAQNLALAEGGGVSVASLSPREFEVIRLYVNGLGVGDIAKRLNRSSRTVSSQKVNAMRKLGVDTDQKLVALCLKSSLIGWGL